MATGQGSRGGGGDGDGREAGKKSFRVHQVLTEAGWKT